MIKYQSVFLFCFWNSAAKGLPFSLCQEPQAWHVPQFCRPGRLKWNSHLLGPWFSPFTCPFKQLSHQPGTLGLFSVCPHLPFSSSTSLNFQLALPGVLIREPLGVCLMQTGLSYFLLPLTSPEFSHFWFLLNEEDVDNILLLFLTDKNLLEISSQNGRGDKHCACFLSWPHQNYNLTIVHHHWEPAEVCLIRSHTTKIIQKQPCWD